MIFRIETKQKKQKYYKQIVYNIIKFIK